MRGVGIGLVVIAACTANDDIHAPHLATVQPDQAPSGTQVQLTGAYFCAQPEPEPGEEIDPLRCDHVGSVVFGTSTALVSIYTDSSILAEVPALPVGDIDIYVSVDGRVSNTLGFSIE
jgi:hypothetical protein